MKGYSSNQYEAGYESGTGCTTLIGRMKEVCNSAVL